MPAARRSRAVRLAVAVLAAAVVLGAATQAAAEVAFRFEGRGFGHGVGMSQFGARGAALAGLDAQRILAHYYRGAVIGTAPTTSLRVRLAESRAAVLVEGTTALRAVPAGGGPATTLPGNTGFRAVVRHGVLHIVGPAGKVRLRASAGALIAAAGPDGLVTLGGKPFRGALRLVPVGPALLDVVNVVELEGYLAGVLPREMPASWGDDTPAALQAQAIAARSYALASRRAERHYDLHSDIRSQVYGGVAGEDPRASAAVEATRGTVLTHGGEVITAFYFSTSGGRTENVENVFGGEPRPYLVSVPDPCDGTSPFHRRWPDPPTVSGSRLGRLLGLGSPVRTFTITRRGVSPRVLSARVDTADGGTHTVSGASVRRVLGLRDTWFHVVRTVTPEPAPAGRFTLDAIQLRINQRISQAAVRRVNAIRREIQGLPPVPAPEDTLRGRVELSTAQLRINQRISQAAVRRVNALRREIRGVAPAPAPEETVPPGRVRLTIAQLRINQRISQAAVRRANALRAELDARQTSR